MIAYDSTIGHYATKLDSNLTYLWMTGINCTTPTPSKCLASTNGFSDSDGTNIHSAYTLQDTPKYTLYFALDLSTGNNVTTVKKTNSDQDVEISSLYVDSNGVAWISLYTNASSGYSELISYDISSGNSTVYKQTGVAYFYQFVNVTNYNYWYGVTYTINTTESIIEGMNYVNILNVTTASGGLIAADEDFDEYTSFPNVSSWVTVTNRSTPNNSALGTGYNKVSRYVVLPGALVPPDVPEEPETNCTTDNGNNSTDTNSTEDNSNTTQNSNSTEASTGFNVSRTVSVASSASVAVTSATVGVAAVTNLVSSATTVSGAGAGGGTSSSEGSQSVWAMVNFYQEILMLPMLGTYMGNNFNYYITEFRLVLFNFQFLKLFQVPFFESGPSIIVVIDYEQPNELFADNEFESGSAFFNCFQIIKAMLIFLIFNTTFLVFR